jgi:NAD(P)-dependent dehydrogenase (short-subunit alcohol dehydrogenase family)
VAGPLDGKVAVVAGGTRGAGRGISIALGELGATVYVTGRTTREQDSPMKRPETIEETAELVTEAGGEGIPVRVDHSEPIEVQALAARLERLDVLVNDVWGGDPLVRWGEPFWKHPLPDLLLLQRQAIETHLITSWHLVPLMVDRGSGLVVEVTDGVGPEYRGNLPYDLVKATVIRLALAQAEDLREHGVAAVAVTPGFLRSEAMLEHFGVTEENWREAAEKDLPQAEHFIASETPRFVGRAVAALAADPNLMEKTGQVLSSWKLSREYGFTDLDGSRPDWGSYVEERGLGLTVE